MHQSRQIHKFPTSQLFSSCTPFNPSQVPKYKSSKIKKFKLRSFSLKSFPKRPENQTRSYLFRSDHTNQITGFPKFPRGILLLYCLSDYSSKRIPKIIHSSRNGLSDYSSKRIYLFKTNPRLFIQAKWTIVFDDSHQTCLKIYSASQMSHLHASWSRIGKLQD